MKKTLFGFMALATALAAVSCQSDEEFAQQPTNKPMDINGVAEATGIGKVRWIQLWADGPKFAEFNVGAINNKAEDYGGYYAWGGIQDKVDDHNTGLAILSGEADTATKLWGNNWRMPTLAELNELRYNCEVQWTTVGGVNGRLFTGKGDYKDNSVFLPAAGYCYDGGVRNQGSYGRYWSSKPIDRHVALSLDFDSYYLNVDGTFLDHGISVRAVLAEEAYDAYDGKGKTFTANGVSFTMMPVEGDEFTMGATSEQTRYASDELPTHRVTLSSYMIGETEVTQELWQAVMGYKPTSGGDQWSSSYGLGAQYPAYYISWNDIQEFITKLNSITGQTFRMPTEAEWEYAARGGNKSKGYLYSGSNTIGDVAWYSTNSGSKTHAVKTKSPNELGLYDMSGNVWEWCSDWYGRYSNSAQTDPIGPSTGSFRVFRGGSWYGSATSCRVAFRSSDTPSLRCSDIGFRLAL